jgi:uncharacterized paraquat-inducible protein A
MKSQPKHENRYCPGCHQTSRHDRVGESLACPRCGSVKYPPAQLTLQRLPESFEASPGRVNRGGCY